MESLILRKIECVKSELGTRVNYIYDAPVSFTNFIKGEDIYVEYPFDMKDVPQSILAIPFVGIAATVSLLLGLNIQVDELDEVFFDSLKRIEQLYIKMYNNPRLQLNIKADKLIKNVYTPERKSLFFTGGVDATGALVEVINENPILINIWGGDIRLTDHKSHAALKEYLDQFSADTGLQYYFVKTNARETFKENELGTLCNDFFKRSINHGWWASIAHIISMASASAPLMYLNKVGVNYIGSSYDASIKTFDANNYEMVKNLRFSSASFKLVQSDIDRNAKIQGIMEYRKKSGIPFELKVCWNRIEGKNCCHCEKCYRTIMNIYSNHGDPKQFGFNIDKETIKEIHRFLQTHIVSTAFWVPIQDAFKKDKDFWKNDADLSWMLSIHLNSAGAYLHRFHDKISR